jgi:hypothetical protein
MPIVVAAAASNPLCQVSFRAVARPDAAHSLSVPTGARAAALRAQFLGGGKKLGLTSCGSSEHTAVLFTEAL